MMISDSLLEQIIEGALMASGHPLSVERIQALFEESDVPDKDRVEAALKRLGERSGSACAQGFPDQHFQQPSPHL